MLAKIELRRLTSLIGHWEKQLESWEKWHCKKPDCDHGMCRIRSSKMCELRAKIDIASDRCYLVEINARNRYA